MSFFTALEFTFTTRHIYNWAMFPLCPSHFILPGFISNCPPLFPSSMFAYLLTWRGLIFQCHIFLAFHIVHQVLSARILEWFCVSLSSGPHFVRTLHYDSSSLGGMAHSFVELCKPPHNNKTVICVWVLGYVWLFVTPWTVASQAPLSWNFPCKNVEWAAISSSRESSQPRDWTSNSCISCFDR